MEEEGKGERLEELQTAGRTFNQEDRNRKKDERVS